MTDLMPIPTQVQPEMHPRTKFTLLIAVGLAVLFTFALTLGGVALYNQLTNSGGGVKAPVAVIPNANQPGATTQTPLPTDTTAGGNPTTTTSNPPGTVAQPPTPNAEPLFPDTKKAPAGWNYYVNTKYGYAFAYPAKYNLYGVNIANSSAASTDNAVEVSVDEVNACNLIETSVVDVADMDKVPSGPSEKPAVLGSQANVTVGSSAAVAKTYSYSDSNFYFTQIVLKINSAKAIKIVYGTRCSPAQVDTYGLKDQADLVKQVLPTFQFVQGD